MAVERESLLTARQAAELMSVSVETIRRLTRAGKLAVFKVGRVNRYLIEDLESYLKKQRREPAKQ